MRACDLLRIHVLDGNRLTVSILPEPQTGLPGDILKSQVAAKFYNTAPEINGKPTRNNGKGACGLRVTLQAYGPMSGVDNMIIRGNSIGRIRIPTAKSRTGLIFEVQRLLDGGAGISRLGKHRHAR